MNRKVSFDGILEVLGYLWLVLNIGAVVVLPVLLGGQAIYDKFFAEEEPAVQTTPTIIQPPVNTTETKKPSNTLKDYNLDLTPQDEDLCVGYPTVCNDGSCSSSTGSGTCSYHEGVWYYRESNCSLIVKKLYSYIHY